MLVAGAGQDDGNRGVVLDRVVPVEESPARVNVAGPVLESERPSLGVLKPQLIIVDDGRRDDIDAPRLDPDIVRVARCVVRASIGIPLQIFPVIVDRLVRRVRDDLGERALDAFSRMAALFGKADAVTVSQLAGRFEMKMLLGFAQELHATTCYTTPNCQTNSIKSSGALAQAVQRGVRFTPPAPR